MTDGQYIEYAPRTNADVYPITAAFERKWREPEYGNKRSLSHPVVRRLFEVAAEVLGEYEHGSADVDQVFDRAMVEAFTNEIVEDGVYEKEVDTKFLLQQYESVCDDLLLSTLSIPDLPRLYEEHSTVPTERLEKLRTGEILPDVQDIIELFTMAKDSEGYVGENTLTMQDFGLWLQGDKEAGIKPGEVTW